jgi:hypothetical protein
LVFSSTSFTLWGRTLWIREGLRLVISYTSYTLSASNEADGGSVLNPVALLKPWRTRTPEPWLASPRHFSKVLLLAVVRWRAPDLLKNHDFPGITEKINVARFDIAHFDS